MVFYRIKKKVWYPVCFWVGKNILHLNHTKGFEVGETVYTWDDERECVDQGQILGIYPYYDEWSGAREDSVLYKSDYLRRLTSNDYEFFRTEEECKEFMHIE